MIDLPVFGGGSYDPPTVEIWPMPHIGRLELITSSGFTTVGDFLPEILEEVKLDVSGQYKYLKQSMYRNGQPVPLFISKDKLRLRDGIHRIAIAYDLKWGKMSVSTTKIVWKQWDESEIGETYHRLWKRGNYAVS